MIIVAGGRVFGTFVFFAECAANACVCVKGKSKQNTLSLVQEKRVHLQVVGLVCENVQHQRVSK